MEKFIEILESEEFKQKIQDAIEEAEDTCWGDVDQDAFEKIDTEEATENVIEVIKSYLINKNA